MEHIWEDHIELIHSYCPKGLEFATIDWLIPENLEYLPSTLESFNKFFVEMMVMIDIVMEDNDYKVLDMISEFLDTGMGNHILTWLGESFRPFLIFPMKVEEDNEFTNAQFSRLISNLMQYSRAKPKEVAPEPVPLAPSPEPLLEPPLEVAAPLEPPLESPIEPSP